MAGYDIQVKVPANSAQNYISPQLNTTYAEPSIVSQGTYVMGWHFTWDNISPNGFTNTGWWGSDISTGPTGSFDSDEAVTTYLQNGNNLNSYFLAWESTLANAGSNAWNIFSEFADELNKRDNGNGCLIYVGTI